MTNYQAKLFYDEYLDGTRDYYYMTYAELVDTFGEEIAVKIWERGAMPDDY